VFLNGSDITDIAIKKRLDMGMSHVPEDRHKHGLVLDFPLEYNFVIHCYAQNPFSIKGVLQPKVISQYAEKLIEQFDVRSGQGKDSIARTMSGGNQQKAIIAREIDRSADLMIVVQPTRGLDVGAIEYIHGRIVKERDNGKAILLMSLELEEIMSLSDRIAVMYNGELTGLIKGEDADENELGLMMAGSLKKLEANI